MKLYASLSAVTLIIILLACKASSPILKDVSKGLQSINRTVGEVNKIADDVQRIKTDVDYIRGNQASNPQPSQNGNTRLGNDKIGEQFQHIGAKKFPKCISGNCINGFGKLQLEEAGSYYEGEFKDGKYHGFGKMYRRYYTLRGNDPANVYLLFEGYHKNGHRSGKGIMYTLDKKVFKGEFDGDYPNGLFTMTKDGLTVLNYYDFGLEIQGFKSLTFEQLKYHQDTVFAKFTKCDCLSKKDFSIPSLGWKNVKYDVISGYTGKKIDEKTELEFGMIEDLEVRGYVNNTNHDIYIRCYRKEYYKKRNIYEYIDDSYVVHPGQKIMANYRIQPQPGELYNLYFEDDFVYLGAYCRKNLTDGCRVLSNTVKKSVTNIAPKNKLNNSKPISKKYGNPK